MGLSIVVVNTAYEDHPEWDDLRQKHDLEFTDFIKDDNCVKNDKTDIYMFKPTDIGRIRADLAKTNWENVSRYEKLLDIIENDEWWLDISC